MRLPAEPPALWHRGVCLLLLCLLCSVAHLARAQTSGDDPDAPPDRVARLSYLAGDLGLLPAGSQDWADADINRPLTTGDRLATSNDSRAELELGGAALRLAGDTDFGLLNLNDNLAQVELTRGTLHLSVRQLAAGQSYEVDTPTLALVVTRPGRFRIDVDNNGSGTRISVLDGRATVYGENNAQHDVFAGRSYQFDDATLDALMITDLAGGDAFDAWSSERDRRYAPSATPRYVSTEVIGYQDLDDYGHWRNSAEYGAVWYPRQVPAGWAPYRNGHWAYIAPWGWTWVDDSPWGFAPYHYGRWAYLGGVWGWIPGPAVGRPVYAPALVAFVGGRGMGVSIGRGSAPVGWFPLGPGEIYNPWYRCDRAYYQRVNVTNIYVHNRSNRTVIINNINRQYGDYQHGRMPNDRRYANRAAPHGFTAMPGNAFANGLRVGRDQQRINPRELANAPVLAHGVSTLRPTTNNMTSARRMSARPLPVADFRRNVVARTPPPATLPAARAPFATTPARPSQTMPHAFGNVRLLNNREPPRPLTNTPQESVRPLRTAVDTHNTTRAMPAYNPRRSNEPLPGNSPSPRPARPDHAELPAVAPLHRADAGNPPRMEREHPSQATRQPMPERRNDNLPQPPRFEHAPAPTPSREPDYRTRSTALPRHEYTPRPTPSPREPMPREYTQPARPSRYEAPRPAAQPPHHDESHAHKEPPHQKPRKDEQEH